MHGLLFSSHTTSGKDLDASQITKSPILFRYRAFIVLPGDFSTYPVETH